MNMILKKRRVLMTTDGIPVTAETMMHGRSVDVVQFTSETHEDAVVEDRTLAYQETTLDYETWQEMGQPEKITVTIEPGDKLNEEDGNV